MFSRGAGAVAGQGIVGDSEIGGTPRPAGGTRLQIKCVRHHVNGVAFGPWESLTGKGWGGGDQAGCLVGQG
jgi:hypothetical protein